ncbi:hypothetical protein [Ramlibacter albus]|uniref:Uncharacterized protein n=1 Tax=Ramlibacter albus TaxID=2079448 RepID=A0A923M3I3_9BURK|nr:hypothetical protein [Ramlibacter albus]MBC5763248.1 hypothetical protein [Ramlibacter albus]
MNATAQPPEATPAEPEGGPLALRPATELRQLPALPPRAAASSPPAPAPALVSRATAAPADPGLPPLPEPPGGNALNVLAGGAAVLAGLGWLLERRRRRLLEMEKDSVFWAHVQPSGGHSAIITTAGNLDDILPDSPDPAEAARAIYVTAIGETNSRREATLIDLHQVRGKLRRRRERGDNVAAVLLLQQHLVDFRYTSPWVFLELRELYKVLDRQNEWDVARDAFRKRFGQNAPHWAAASHEDAALADDKQLCEELTQFWPYREARMFVLRLMLGEPEMRQKCSGPPLLPLGVYRDILMLDEVLDEVMVARPKQVADSLL